MIKYNLDKYIEIQKIHFTDVTDKYIQDKIDEYNKSNEVIFSDINTFPKYALNINSIHYDISNRFIVWADKIWLTVRTITDEPTEEEFIALLDTVVF